ncbi:uncharacterized protein BDV14DRAFT_195862 [Aspergillus stella-maris]|uniref:uncharacterized protein n=1 Tax=Aspergillus stella-maris TaxID=1810926 RepID=UPI003CCDE870
MDYERCAALHNELLTRVVEGCGGKMPDPPLQIYWEAFNPSDEIAEALHPSVIEFLNRAWNEDIMLKHTLKASWIEDYNDTQIIAEHGWSWMPLEVILDSYLQMIDEKKVDSIPVNEWKEYSSRERELDCRIFHSPWIIHQFTQIDLDKTVTAFNRLVHAIESRMELRDYDEAAYMNLPWHDLSMCDQNFIPLSSFAHEFLSATANIKVRFRYIAPGIRFPTLTEFLDQPVTDFENSRHILLGQFPGNYPHWIQDPIYKRTDLVPGFYIHHVTVKPPPILQQRMSPPLTLRNWTAHLGAELKRWTLRGRLLGLPLRLRTESEPKGAR